VTRVSTYKTIGSYAPKKTSGKGDKERDGQGSFAQPDKKCSTEIACFNCHKKGHIAKNCPENTNTPETATTYVQTGESEGASAAATTSNPHGGRAAAQFMTWSALNMHGSQSSPSEEPCPTEEPVY
jgi:Zinc knuckle